MIPGIVASSASGGGGGGGEYTGPLDLVPGAVVAFGLRALAAAMRGQSLVRLRRSSDDAELDWPADAVTGLLDVAAIATWGGEGSLYVVTVYDQSGNGQHISQSDPLFQPLYDPDVQGGRPGWKFAGVESSGDELVRNPASVAFTSGAISIALAGGTGNNGEGSLGCEPFAWTSEDNAYTDLSAGSGTKVSVDMYDEADNEAGGSANADWSVVAFRVLDAAWQSGSKALFVNGAEQTFDTDYDFGGPITDFTITQIAVQGRTVGIGEFIAWDALNSAPNQTSVRANLATHYSIPLP